MPRRGVAGRPRRDRTPDLSGALRVTGGRDRSRGCWRQVVRAIGQLREVGHDALGRPPGSIPVLVGKRHSPWASCVIRMVPSTGRLLLGPTEVVAPPVPGPGFHELGESLQLTADGMTTTTALTVGSSRTSQIIFVVWHAVPSRTAPKGTATTGSP
jgi:hypothetical protein